MSKTTVPHIYIQNHKGNNLDRNELKEKHSVVHIGAKAKILVDLCYYPK